MTDALVSFVRSRPELKARLERALHAIGYDTADWMRIVMYRHCFEFVRGLEPERLDALEISAGPQWKRQFRFGSY
ncbi:MAG: methyltransferase type 12, partial [Alphaproteobacteria bacterium]|nr:methyltransferase type 12 [Alphaproteobacteria bacterium]MBV9860766.1 methyltransferase type 12 [Alphaproteobacteria bacterium]